MRKRILILSMILVVILSACSNTAGTENSLESERTYQDYYDLGIRYLSENNYEEAIIAFTAAIEIDPKQASAYVGRGDAYIGLGETEENLTAAQADYEKAIALDETNTAAYLGLADVYIRKGEYEKAQQLLENALGKTESDQAIIDKITEVKTSTDRFSRSDQYVAFEYLSKDICSYIDSLIEAIQNNDAATLHDILKSHTSSTGDRSLASNSPTTLRTQVSEYKVEINVGDRYSYIEARPRTGTAVYAKYEVPDWDDSGNSETITYITGECDDWNWNGKFESYGHRYEITDNHVVEQENWESGTAKDCLKDGMVYGKVTYGADGQMTTETYQKQYEYGVLPGVEGYYLVEMLNSAGGIITTMTHIENTWWWN